MKIITLWQPWATLIALGYKRIETRSWQTSYKGKLAIHAAKRPVKQSELEAIAFESNGDLWLHNLNSFEYPLGKVVCVVDLVGCYQMTNEKGCNGLCYGSEKDGYWHPSTLEKAVGLWEPGRYAWVLENIQQLSEPIECKGGQGLRNFPPSLLWRLNNAIN